MTAKKIFLFYVVASTLAAQYYVFGYSEETLFNYGTLVDSISLLRATRFLVIGLVAFAFGSYIAKYFFVAVKESSYRSSGTPVEVRHLSTWQILGIVSITSFYVFVFATSVLQNGMPVSLSERVFENKFSALLLVMLAYFGYVSSFRKHTILFRAVILIISLSVVIVDHSRSGLIPMLGLLFGALSRKRLLSVFLLTYLLFFEANFAITARSLDDTVGLNMLYSYLFPDLELAMEAFKAIFDYLFAFSVLNFTYMVFIAQPQYTWAQLFTSINPLPSYFINPDDIELLKFEDHTRAIGGPAELLSVGIMPFLIGLFLIGVLAAYADTIINSRFRFIILLMFLLASIIFFEYNLRTSMRIFLVIFVVVFLLKRKLVNIVRQTKCNSSGRSDVAAQTVEG